MNQSQTSIDDRKLSVELYEREEALDDFIWNI